MVFDTLKNVSLNIDSEIKDVHTDVLTAKEWLTKPDELRLQYVKAHLQIIRAKIAFLISRYDHHYKSQLFQLLKCGESKREMLFALLSAECAIQENGTICLKCNTEELRKYFFDPVERVKDRPSGLREVTFLRTIEQIISFVQTAESCALEVRVGAALAHLGRAKDAIDELMNSSIGKDVKLRFIHLLESPDLEFNGDVCVADVDMEHAFVWGKEQYESEITEEGKKYFAELVNSDCEILNSGAIYIHCDNEEMGEYFFAVCAGYSSVSECEKYFIN